MNCQICYISERLKLFGWKMPVSLIKCVLYFNFYFQAAKVIYAGVIFAHQNRIFILMKIKCLVLTCYLYAATKHKFVFS